MRRSSDVLVPQDPISCRRLLFHVCSSFAVFTVGFWLFVHYYTHPPTSSFCPNFFPNWSSSSSPFTHPTLLFTLPHHTCSATPWKSRGFLPSAEVPAIAAHISPSLHHLCPRFTAENTWISTAYKGSKSHRAISLWGRGYRSSKVWSSTRFFQV